MCCAVGDWQSKLHPKQQKQTEKLSHITGKAPRQAPTTTCELQLSLPRSFSLRENLTIKKLICTRGGEGENGSQDATGVLVSVERPLSRATALLPRITKKRMQSQKEKSARKGTGSPVLWQVRESAGTTTQTLP